MNVHLRIHDASRRLLDFGGWNMLSRHYRMHIFDMLKIGLKLGRRAAISSVSNHVLNSRDRPVAIPCLRLFGHYQKEDAGLS